MSALIVGLAILLSGFLVLGATVPTAAFAQGANNQYEPPGPPGPPPGPPGGPTDPGDERDQRPIVIEEGDQIGIDDADEQLVAAPGAGVPPSGVSEPAQLPFTGFPLFPLLLLIALLIATGLLMRGALAMRQRSSAPHA